MFDFFSYCAVSVDWRVNRHGLFSIDLKKVVQDCTDVRFCFWLLDNWSNTIFR